MGEARAAPEPPSEGCNVQGRHGTLSHVAEAYTSTDDQPMYSRLQGRGSS